MLHLSILSLGLSLLTGTWFGLRNFGWGVGNVPAETQKRVITPELSEYIGNIVWDHHIPGLAFGVVHSNGTVETAVWGNRTEEGEEVTADVSLDD